MKNNNGPRIHPFGAQAWALAHDKFWPLSTTLCFLFLEKSDKLWKSLREMPFCFNLKTSPLCQALDVSKKITRTSNPLSKDVKVS